MRAFLALDLTDEVREHLACIRDEIKITNRGKGTWSRPENYHISLAFLDEITKDQADVLMRILRTKAPGHKPFTLKLNRLGYFMDENNATVWCSVNPDNNLKSLVSDVYQSVRESRIHFDSKPFKAHITLGRKINLMNCRLSSIEVRPLEIPVNSIVLVKSTLLPDGPVYRVVDEINL